MTTYKELLAQRDTLDAQIAQAEKLERTHAIAQVHSLVEQFQLTSRDVFSTKSAKKSGRVVAPKYRDPETGSTWSGRGKPPAWISGKDRGQFAV